MKIKKVSKFFGMILAITLPITLIGAIALVFMFPSQELFKNSDWGGGMHNNWLSPWSHRGPLNNQWDSNDPNLPVNEVQTFNQITTLDVSGVVDHISIGVSNSDETTVTYNGNRTIGTRVNMGRLTIRDEKYRNDIRGLKGLFSDAGTIVIAVPSSVSTIRIEAGFSLIEIKDIQTAKIDVDGGMGAITLNGVSATQEVDLESGVGNVSVLNANINDLDLDVGIGRISIDTLVATKVDIDGGIGNVTIHNSTISHLSTENGIGNLTITDSEIARHDKD